MSPLICSIGRAGSMSHLAGISLLHLLPCPVCAGSGGRSHRHIPTPCSPWNCPGRRRFQAGVSYLWAVTGTCATDTTSGVPGNARGKSLVALLCCHGNHPGLHHQIHVDHTVPIMVCQSGWDFKEKSDTDAPISHIYPHFLSDIFLSVAFPSKLSDFL